MGLMFWLLVASWIVEALMIVAYITYALPKVSLDGKQHQ